MSSTSQIAGLISVLESNFRQLANDARKSEGLSSFFSNADSHPEVKEAAERAVMKVRALADVPNALEQIKQSKDILKPIQLACDTKSARLINDSLSIVQKLLSNEALPPEGPDIVISLLARVEKISDEGVQLKTLQTALTLLQSPLHPTTEDAIATVLGICFRSFMQKGRKESVTSTAAATVRQSVALVFTYVDVPKESARIEKLKAAGIDFSPNSKARYLQQQGDHFDGAVNSAVATDDAAPSPELITSQKLLEDLIAITTGAPPSWIQTPSLPRTFILEVLDFALANSSDLFKAIPEFESTLSLRISQLLQSQLQDYLDAGQQYASSNFLTYKATFRCIRTLLLKYHHQLKGRCGSLIQTMLRALSPSHPPIQRIAAAQIIRQLLSSLPLVHYLFVTYDMQKGRMFDAVHALVRGTADVVDGCLKDGIPAVGSTAASSSGAKDAVGEDAVDAIGSLYQQRALGKDWSVESEYDTAPVGIQQAYLAMLAIDSLLNLMASVDRLTDMATANQDQEVLLGSGSSSKAISAGQDEILKKEIPSAHHPIHQGESGGFTTRTSSSALVAERSSTGSKIFSRLSLDGSLHGAGGISLSVDRKECCAMIDSTWRATLAVFGELLNRCHKESLLLILLKGYQGYTQACGLLEMEEPRDAFLKTLCSMALSTNEESASLGGDGGKGASIGSESPRSPPSRSGGRGDGAPLPRSPPARVSSMDSIYESGIILTPKNVQAMRTLFNIAHRLANVLGPAWAYVLETLNTLDKILNSPKTTTQEMASGGVTGAAVSGGVSSSISSDVAILSAAASQLFECTRDMSRDAVVALLSGLRDVSLNNLPHAMQVSQIKLYALNRMVEVLLYNINRIYDLWAVFLSHVLEVISDPKPPVRAAAVDALGRSIIGALATLPPGSSTESTGGLEHMLLVALEALYNDDREQDIRLGVLRVLLNVLQHHGERLTDGWTPVFRLLAIVPGQGDAETIDLGFQSVQLVCSDYMSAMPFPRLKKCLEVAVAYGKQPTDINVSLTTISLLWNAGDMLGRSRAADGEADMGESAVHYGEKRHNDNAATDATHGLSSQSLNIDDPTALPVAITLAPRTNRLQQTGGQFIGVVTPAHVEELLVLIFSALQTLSEDHRPEVRNSGARTLFAVVVTQGPRLSRSLWELSLWDMLFPLLRHAFHMSATSSKEEAEAALLGRSRGEQVRLVVHHSRNTEQKQWDETVVVAVGGMTRLLRAHLPAICSMDGISDGWDELMVVAESSLAGGRKEVALAAIGLLGGVLAAHGRDETIVSPAMWNRALRALDVGVEAATSAGCQVPLAARTEMVSLVGTLYGTLRKRFSTEDTKKVFRWTEGFCRNPWSEDDANNPVQTIGMPPVQKAALALLPALVPDHKLELWPDFVLSIVRLIQPEHIEAHWKDEMMASMSYSGSDGDGVMSPASSGGVQSQDQEGSGGIGLGGVPGLLGTGALPSSSMHIPAKQAQYRFAINTTFLEKVFEQLSAVYCDAPPAVRVAVMTDVVEALGRCMEMRFTAYQDSLWRAAATTFNKIVPIGISAIAITSETSASIWPALALSFENFLLGDKFQRMIKAQLAPTAFYHATSGSIGATDLLSKATTAPPKQGTHKKTASLPVVPVLEVKNTSQKQQENSSQHNNAASELPRKRGTSLLSRKKSTTVLAGSSKSTATPHESSNPTTKTSMDQPQDNGDHHDHLAVDVQQSRADAELELSILDTLTDSVLVFCGTASVADQQRLIGIVDRGISRPRSLNIPQATTGSNFSHVCIRKMFVLCSRSGGSSGVPVESDSTLDVAKLALPPFLARCDGMLRAFAEETRPGSLGDGPPVDRPRLDEIMCVLEVLATMSLSPAVVDATIPPNEPVTEVVHVLRKRPEVAMRGKERTHLLLLFDALCGCITSKEARVREMVRDVLGLAGAELGVGAVLLLRRGSSSNRRERDA